MFIATYTKQIWWHFIDSKTLVTSAIAMLPGVSKHCITRVCGDVPCSVVTTRLTPLRTTGRVCAVDTGTLLGGARRQYWSHHTSCLRGLKKGSEWCTNVIKTLQHGSRETMKRTLSLRNMDGWWLKSLLLSVLKSKGIYIIQQSVASLHQILQWCTAFYAQNVLLWMGFSWSINLWVNHKLQNSRQGILKHCWGGGWLDTLRWYTQHSTQCERMFIDLFRCLSTYFSDCNLYTFCTDSSQLW